MKKTAALSAVACVLLATAAAQTRTSNQRDLPLFADDLSAGERYYTFDHADTFSQKFGYDISVRRMKSDGNWTAVKDGVTDYSANPANENNLAWGKNFYAMADGVIIGCWRNAPSNPRPKLSSESNDTTELKDRGWIHQNLKDGLMSGGGNHVSVLHDDGTYALYAHAIPGSIPASLCPNNKTKYDQPESDSDPRTEHCVRQSNAVQNGARIKKGQFLGKIGNSGSSTGPHLHVHIAKYDKSKACTSDLVLQGVPIKFSRGMSTPWNSGKADIDAWTSFSGKPITKGTVLFWPPTRLSDEYARHGFQP